MEQFACFKYRIYKCKEKNDWHYQIFDDDEKLLRKSNEPFGYEGIARLAAIGHISWLEQNKG